mgnify:CR=1
MKTILLTISILFCLQITTSAQTTATWAGGTPGRAQDWNCPTNWKEGRVPDEFSQVIIPADRHTYPVIRTEVNDIDALLVEGGSTLTLAASGELTVLGESGRLNGMSIIGGIQNDGMLRYEGIGNATAQVSGQISGEGTMMDLSGMTANKD